MGRGGAKQTFQRGDLMGASDNLGSNKTEK